MNEVKSPSDIDPDLTKLPPTMSMAIPLPNSASTLPSQGYVCTLDPLSVASTDTLTTAIAQSDYLIS